MELQKELLEAVKNNLNIPGLFQELFKDVAKKAIEELVQKTPTVLDDVAAAAILPVLETELNAKVKELWEKLFVVQPAPAPSQGSGDVL